MSALEEMKIEINIGDVSLEEDGFSAVTDAFENPFEEETGSREELPVQDAGMETEKTVETAEKNDSQETGAEASGMETDSEDKKRAEHGAAEARRKEEWEARQQEKKELKKALLERIKAMNDAELISESMKRVEADTEKLTRRNMKECVSEYIQTLCLEDVAFAGQVMLPQKNMVRCFQYINRKAYEYV